MRKSVSAVIAAGILLLGVSVSLAQSGPATTADTAKGKALVDGKGMTLYIFDRDTAGTSNCNGVCATNWPPFEAAADAKAAAPWTVISRSGGAKQWAYNGKPLYNFGKDARLGDVKGDGLNNVWHIAAP